MKHLGWQTVFLVQGTGASWVSSPLPFPCLRVPFHGACTRIPSLPPTTPSLSSWTIAARFELDLKMSTSRSRSHGNMKPTNNNNDETVICEKCRGEGSFTRQSRRSSLQAKRNKNKNHINSQVPQPAPASNEATVETVVKQACKTCDGTGLLLRTRTHSPNHEFLSDAQTKTLTTETTTTLNKNEPSQAQPHVAIIGGGIGGLALALALQHRHISCKVYERDLHFHQRRQGYGLTMQQGGRALRALGFFLHANKKQNTQEEEDDDDAEEGFGIYSKRHLVHTPNGTVVGQWGMDVWKEKDKQHLPDHNDVSQNPNNGISHQHNTKKKKKKKNQRQNAHISRQALRFMLLQKLHPDTIAWGYKLQQYREGWDKETGQRRVNLTFCVTSANASRDTHAFVSSDMDAPTTLASTPSTDIKTASATVLVGADGIRSSVRRQKLPSTCCTPLRYLHCIVILGIAPSPMDSDLTKDGQTVFQTADGITRLYAMPFSKPGEEVIPKIHTYHNKTTSTTKPNPTAIGTGETMWQLSFPLPENQAKEYASQGPHALKKEALRRCSTWHAPIPQLLESTPVELISGYPVYDRALPTLKELRRGYESNVFDKGMQRSSRLEVDEEEEEVHEGEEKILLEEESHVTLLGDAAHPMSPFKGQGANQALIDAVSLARALYKAFRMQATRRQVVASEEQEHVCKKPRPEESKTTYTNENPNANTNANENESEGNIATKSPEKPKDEVVEMLARYEAEMLERSASKVKASAMAAEFLHSEVAVMEGDMTRGAAAAKATNEASLGAVGVAVQCVEED